jgi:beta-galactosidase
VTLPEGLISEGAKVIVGYDHPHFGRFPAVVSTAHAHGRITAVGTLPNPDLATGLALWLAPKREAWGELPDSVTVSSATNAHDERIHVVHNWAWEPVRLSLPRPMTDLLTDAGRPGPARSRPVERARTGGLTVSAGC